MTKSCNNCYWVETYRNDKSKFCAYEQTKPNQPCDEHNFKCEHCSWDYKGVQRYSEIAQYLYKGDVYCEKCMAEKLGIELREVTYNQFYSVHGDYLGDENETSLDNIFRDCPNIECLED